jgi:hypothetical protein
MIGMRGIVSVLGSSLRTMSCEKTAVRMHEWRKRNGEGDDEMKKIPLNQLFVHLHNESYNKRTVNFITNHILFG